MSTVEVLDAEEDDSVNETKPLLVSANPTLSLHLNTTQDAVENDTTFTQELAKQRSDSMICWLSFAWLATFHCLTSVRALESTICLKGDESR